MGRGWGDNEMGLYNNNKNIQLARSQTQRMHVWKRVRRAQTRVLKEEEEEEEEECAELKRVF